MEHTRKISRFYAKLLKSGRQDPDFFEFVRRIEQASGGRMVGKSSDFQREPVRFGQMPYLHFPQTSIAEISEREFLLIFVFFMGLTGNNGPLPLEFTNYAFQRSHNYYDFTVRRFHDIINHRFIGLFYRAWKAGEQAVDLDQPDGGLITDIIRALSGYAGGKTALPRHTDAYWSGIFGNAVKSRAGLEEILNGRFKLPVRIVDQIVSCADIPDVYRCRLGKRSTAELGQTLQLGSRFYCKSRKFVVEIGPVSFAACRFVLPGTQEFNDLTMMVCRYLDRPLEYDLKFILKSGTLPHPKLNGRHQLGRDLWLSGPRPEGHTVLVIGASRLMESKHKKSYHIKEQSSWAN